MKKGILAVLTGIVLTVGTAFPTVSFAYPEAVDDDSTNYEYYDEYGNIIEDEENEEAPVEQGIAPDTSWFNYLEKKKSYTISTEAQLIGLASLVNEQQALWKPDRFESFEDVTFTLQNDIKLTQPWVPIGSDDQITFKGVFDGNGHTISDINVDITGDYAGFFGYLSGKVKDLTVSGNIKATGGKAGGLAGYLANGAKVVRCTSNVNVSAGSETGGIVGRNNLGTVRKCVNKGEVEGSFKVGGIVGENWGKIVCCGNSGKVTSTTRGRTTFGTGGVAGRSVSVDSRIDRCFNNGDIVSATEGTGGLVGYTNTKGSTIINSYNTGNVSVKNPKTNALNELASTNAKGYAGGIAGIVGTKGIKIKNCYNAGTIMNTQITGGVIGKYDNSSKTKDDSYISNNYFVNQNTKYGVGVDSSGSSRNISRGTTATSLSSLINGSSNLGPYYISDSSGSYGNHNLPVLDWQKPLGEDEVNYLSGMPVSTQKDLNRYMLSEEKKGMKGEAVKMFFTHYDFISYAIGEYKDAK